MEIKAVQVVGHYGLCYTIKKSMVLFLQTAIHMYILHKIAQEAARMVKIGNPLINACAQNYDNALAKNK